MCAIAQLIKVSRFSPVSEGSQPAVNSPALVPVERSEPVYFDALRTAKGDALQKAFAELWKDEAARMIGWLKKKYWSLPNDILECAVNDAFVAVWNVVDEGGGWEKAPMASVSGIYEIARRRAADALRVLSKRGKVKPVILRPNDEIVQFAYGPRATHHPNDKRSTEHEDAEHFEFLAHQLRDAIARLPRQQQRVAEILVDCYEDYDDLTYEEIQELYQKKFEEEIPFASVKSAKTHIIEKLAPIYEPYRRRYTTLWNRISPTRKPTE